MGMKEEITGIAKALGYKGATPTSKTSAVRAVAEVAGSGGGGGESGYDVTITKTWVLEEQTVTSYAVEGPDGQGYVANVTLADGCDFAQMYSDGKTALKLVADGVETDVTLVDMGGGAYIVATDPQDTTAGLQIMIIDGENWAIGLFSDTEPTAHTVSCWHQETSVTTTPEFDAAVKAATNDGLDVNVTLDFTDEYTADVETDVPIKKINAAKSKGLEISYYLDGVKGKLTSQSDTYAILTFASVDYDSTNNNSLDGNGCAIGVTFDGMGNIVRFTFNGKVQSPLSNLAYVVTITPNGSPWTLDKSVVDIYNAYDSGKRVVFRISVYDAAPIYLEGVTRASRPSFSVTEFVFEKVFVNSANNQLVNYKYNVSTVNNTPTMTLTQTAYQLTPAS